MRGLDCPGMCIDEAFSNVNLLMYADNIYLMNDTIGRLQNSIEILILSTFCDKYGLKVNMSKTNVIIFSMEVVFDIMYFIEVTQYCASHITNISE